MKLIRIKNEERVRTSLSDVSNNTPGNCRERFLIQDFWNHISEVYFLVESMLNKWAVDWWKRIASEIYEIIPDDLVLMIICV
jgi:hypothetical protein